MRLSGPARWPNSLLPQSPNGSTLKPIGYVEKGDGSVEAVVSDAYGVQLVHLGDAYQQKYMVASIASDAVELVAVSHQAEPVTTVVLAASKPDEANPKPSGPGRDQLRDSAGKTAAVTKPLRDPAQIERVARRSETAATAEAAAIDMLSPKTPTAAAAVAPAAGLIEGSSGMAGTVQHAIYGAQRVEVSRSPVETAARREDTLAARTVADPGQSLTTPRLSQKTSLTGTPSPEPQPSSGGPATAATSGLEPPGSAVADVRGPPTGNVAPGFSPAGATDKQLVRSYGYAQWQDGRTLAVVDDGAGGVRLTHKGEIVDGRFQVVEVYQEAVEVAQLPLAPSDIPGLMTLEADAPKTTAPHFAVPVSPRDGFARAWNLPVLGRRSLRRICLRALAVRIKKNSPTRLPGRRIRR